MIEIIKQKSIKQPRISTTQKNSLWLYYDTDNLFPQRLQNIQYSPVHISILKKKTEYACGLGWNTDDAEAKMFLNSCSFDGSFNNLMYRCFNDYIKFGGFSIHCIYNQDKTKIVQLQHIPFQCVRVEFPTLPGSVNGYYVSNDWKQKNYEQNKPVYLPSFGSFNENKAELLYSFDYSDTLLYYPIPTYFSGINYIELEENLSIFFNEFTKNNFTPSLSITFPNSPDEPSEMQEIHDKLMEFYGGAENAGKLMVLYGENGQVPLVNLFPQQNPDLYNNIYEIVIRNILSVHGITSPTLVGLSGNGGLGGNSSEIGTAYEMFLNQVIEPIRKKFLNEIKRILYFNFKRDVNIWIENLSLLKFNFSESFLQNILTTNEQRELIGYEPITKEELQTENYDMEQENIDMMEENI